MNKFIRHSKWLVAILFATNVSCSQPIENPASVCASKETIGSIFGIIEDHNIPAVAFGVNNTNQIKQLVEKLISQNIISLANITFEGADKDTGKISCKGIIHIGFGNDTDTAMRVKNDIGDSDIPISYSRQSSADDKSWIYSYSGGDDIAQVALIAEVQLMKERAQKSAVEPDTTNSSPPTVPDINSTTPENTTQGSSSNDTGTIPSAQSS